MDRLKSFQNVITAIGIAVGVIITKYLPDWINDQQIPEWLSLTLSLIVVSFSYYFFRFSASYLIEYSIKIRKFFLRHRFIEGTWMESITSSQEDSFIGIVRIDYEGHSLSLSGENFTLDGIPRGSFRADMAVFEWPVIKYKYTWTRHTKPRHSTNGYGEIHFAKQNSYPKRFHGFFVDLEDGIRHDFMGWKEEDPTILSEFDKPETLRKAIREFSDVNKI